MRTPAQIIADTVKDAKQIPHVLTLALVVVQMIEGKIADFDLVALMNEAAALAQFTQLVNAGWVAIGVYIIAGSRSGKAHRISSGPLREFKGDAQVEKFLTDLVDRIPVYDEAESADSLPLRQIRVIDRQKKRPRFSA
jgi:hypothetical protein